MASQTHSVITFATNKFSYLQFALNCAQSILLHNDIPIYIVSNLEAKIPEIFKEKVFIIRAKPGHAELGIGIKLHIDEYLKTAHTLFIDSDCLCYGSLEDIFKACLNMDVGVAGNIVPAWQWCGKDQATTVKKVWGLDNLIRYNGGLYYLRQSETTTRIFNTAREIGEKYDDYGFSRIKNKWINEEGPISIAMMIEGEKPLADDGSFMTDLYTDMRPKIINVLQGERVLRNKPTSHANYRPWYPALYSPVIIHFGGSQFKSYPYRSQTALLKLKNKGIPTAFAVIIVNITLHIPYRLYHWLRSAINSGRQ